MTSEQEDTTADFAFFAGVRQRQTAIASSVRDSSSSTQAAQQGLLGAPARRERKSAKMADMAPDESPHQDFQAPAAPDEGGEAVDRPTTYLSTDTRSNQHQTVAQNTIKSSSSGRRGTAARRGEQEEYRHHYNGMLDNITDQILVEDTGSSSSSSSSSSSRTFVRTGVVDALKDRDLPAQKRDVEKQKHDGGADNNADDKEKTDNHKRSGPPPRREEDQGADPSHAPDLMRLFCLLSNLLCDNAFVRQLDRVCAQLLPERSKEFLADVVKMLLLLLCGFFRDLVFPSLVILWKDGAPRVLTKAYPVYVRYLREPSLVVSGTWSAVCVAVLLCLELQNQSFPLVGLFSGPLAGGGGGTTGAGAALTATSRSFTSSVALRGVVQFWLRWIVVALLALGVYNFAQRLRELGKPVAANRDDVVENRGTRTNGTTDVLVVAEGLQAERDEITVREVDEKDLANDELRAAAIHHHELQGRETTETDTTAARSRADEMNGARASAALRERALTCSRTTPENYEVILPTPTGRQTTTRDEGQIVLRTAEVEDLVCAEVLAPASVDELVVELAEVHRGTSRSTSVEVVEPELPHLPKKTTPAELVARLVLILVTFYFVLYFPFYISSRGMSYLQDTFRHLHDTKLRGYCHTTFFPSALYVEEEVFARGQTEGDIDDVFTDGGLMWSWRSPSPSSSATAAHLASRASAGTTSSKQVHQLQTNASKASRPSFVLLPSAENLRAVLWSGWTLGRALLVVLVTFLLTYVWIEYAPESGRAIQVRNLQHLVERMQNYHPESGPPLETLCCACLDQKKSVLLLPCNHISLCKDCFFQLRAPRCPLCNQRCHKYVEPCYI
ncbi:unnamed protein product [Amoebophrya sp. A120]|nr:unnamed protein product [Amoebophrya sp. A120]|eukprot:GSA120T00022641001.1